MKSLFSCPMHPEVERYTPSKCPKCGMKLVTKDSLTIMRDKTVVKSSYTPLLVIIGLVLLISLTISYVSGFSFTSVVYNFMIGFFLVFAGFKLMDLSGFAEGYATYDLLAQRVYGYGYIYPFIELFFGLVMILHFQTKTVFILEIIVMLFSGIGVGIKLAKHEKFQCACLGTFLKVPLTKVTLIEDFGMAFMALAMVIYI